MNTNTTPPPAGANQAGVKKPLWKKWWFWLIVVIALFVIAGLAKPSGEPTSDSAPAASQSGDAAAAQEETKAPEAAPQEQNEPEVTIEATALSKAYVDNELAADKEYKGKLARVTGTLDGVADVLGSKSVTLKGENSDFSVNNVACLIPESEVDKAAALSKGSNVTVVGTVDGFNQIDVTLSECIIE